MDFAASEFYPVFQNKLQIPNKS